MNNAMLIPRISFTNACIPKSKRILQSGTQGGSGNRRRARRKTRTPLPHQDVGLTRSQIFHFSTVWEDSRMVWKKDDHAYTWHDLAGHVAAEILCVPRTG